jgi:hypothetical protein
MITNLSLNLIFFINKLSLNLKKEGVVGEN